MLRCLDRTFVLDDESGQFQYLGQKHFILGRRSHEIIFVFLFFLIMVFMHCLSELDPRFIEPPPEASWGEVKRAGSLYNNKLTRTCQSIIFSTYVNGYKTFIILIFVVVCRSINPILESWIIVEITLFVSTLMTMKLLCYFWICCVENLSKKLFISLMLSHRLFRFHMGKRAYGLLSSHR